MQDYTQLGISGLTLGILFFVVKYFVSAMQAKDNQQSKMVEMFNTTVNNHIHHSNDTLKEVGAALKDLTQELKSSNKGRRKKVRI